MKSAYFFKNLRPFEIAPFDLGDPVYCISSPDEGLFIENKTESSSVFNRHQSVTFNFSKFLEKLVQNNYLDLQIMLQMKN